MTARSLGLIVNPIAGVGGRLGLKGSDGAETLALAAREGAMRLSGDRAAEALDELSRQGGLAGVTLLVAPGEMGAAVADRLELAHTVVGGIPSTDTTAEDTRRIASAMADEEVDLLLFAGGDGTARDVYDAVGADLPALGIPSGVKIHSSVFATHPRTAGRLAAAYLRNGGQRTTRAEVMDLDEEALRGGVVVAGLYGHLLVPEERTGRQGLKSGTSRSEAQVQADIAAGVIDRMESGRRYVIGPGTTTYTVKEAIAPGGSLLGVDVFQDGRLVGSDVAEKGLIELTTGANAEVVVSPIGGQGYVFGRGNQQISPAVIEAVGPERLTVVATPGKLASLRGRPMLVDTGDPALDERLAGYVRVIAGRHEEALYPLRAPGAGEAAVPESRPPVQ